MYFNSKSLPLTPPPHTQGQFSVFISFINVEGSPDQGDLGDKRLHAEPRGQSKPNPEIQKAEELKSTLVLGGQARLQDPVSGMCPLALSWTAGILTDDPVPAGLSRGLLGLSPGTTFTALSPVVFLSSLDK